MSVNTHTSSVRDLQAHILGVFVSLFTQQSPKATPVAVPGPRGSTLVNRGTKNRLVLSSAITRGHYSPSYTIGSFSSNSKWISDDHEAFCFSVLEKLSLRRKRGELQICKRVNCPNVALLLPELTAENSGIQVENCFASWRWISLSFTLWTILNLQLNTSESAIL